MQSQSGNHTGEHRGWYSRRVTSRLKAVVKQAYEQVPLYRTRFDQIGLKPEHIRTLDDILKLPFTSKEDLRVSFPDGILAGNYKRKKPVVVSTGGHSGLPVRLYRDSKLLRNSALSLIFLSGFIPGIIRYWTGLKTGRRVSLIFPVDPEYDIYLIMKQALDWPRALSGFLQYIDSAQSPLDQLKAIRSHRPDILVTDPNTLCNMAMVAREAGITPHRPSLLLIAEELMVQQVKDIVTRTFGGCFIEHYGAEEVGTIGFSCLKHRGFHIMTGSVVVEILQDGQPVPRGKSGDIVVTDLTNMASPILRYTGLKDRGMISDKPCDCGSPLPLLTLLEARVRDSFMLPDRRVVHPRSLVAAFKNVPHIADYQLIQESEDRIKILVVPDDKADEEPPSQFAPVDTLEQMIKANVAKLLGEEVHIEVERVKEIAKEPGLRLHPTVYSLVRHRAISLD